MTAPGAALLGLSGYAFIAVICGLIVPAATYISAIPGAVAGREVFERLGAAAPPRVQA